MTAFENKQCTILFADITGSTRLYDQLGDRKALELVNTCIGKIHTITEKYKGQIIKTIGDEVMCRFEHPDQAALSAIEMNEKIIEDYLMSQYSMRLRTGFHHGPALKKVGDLYGDAVNVAARMASQAKSGQIITTRSTLERMSSSNRNKARLVDQTRVKGKKKVFEIFEITWGQPEEVTMMSSFMSGHLELQNQLESQMVIQFQNRKITVNQSQPIVTIGRDINNHLVIKEPLVSRIHSRIELRRGKFLLVDQSTNGTYILPEADETVLMRRDEIILPPKGVISLGKKVSLNSPLAIKFQII
ncbi:MAG: adenylate/guanylate cyclase domain-containing protein [Desulfobacteraceae bacterium]|nr:adenylate/guanylate cyclase domain-containing protein [Desulfobacteraceae bacterium]